MRALGTALGLWLAFGTAALAQWTPVAVGGLPADVEITDAGVVAVATDTAARFIEGSGGTFTVDNSGPAGNMVSAFVDDQGRLCATHAMDTVACGTDTMLVTPPSTGDLVQRSRHTANGGRYISLVNDNIAPSFAFAPGPFVAPFPPIEVVCGSITGAVSALSASSGEWGLMVLGPGGCGMQLMHEDVLVEENGYGDHGLGTVNEAALYEASDGGLSALLAHGAGLSQVTFLDGGTDITPITSVVGPAGNVVGVAFSLGDGDQHGDGFGMAVVSDTEDQIWGAIPDPENPGQTWVDRTPATVGFVPALGRIACQGAARCAAIAAASTGSNVLVYENLNPPTISVPMVEIPETDTSALMAATVDDPDGDPVFVRWFPDAGSGISASPIGPSADSATLQLASQAQICDSFEDFVVRASVSDGDRAHVRFTDGVLRIHHTVPPGAPTLDGPTTTFAGATPISLIPDPASGSCPLVDGIGWTETSSVPGAILDVADGGTSALFTPPEHLCQDSATLEVELIADDGFLQSSAGIYTLEVQGWGAPNRAFPVGATATQPSGEIAFYSADGGHFCDGTLGLPPLTTEWDIASSDIPGASLILNDDAVTGPVLADQIGLRAPECSSGTVVLSATQIGGDTAALPGPEGELTVSVVTTLDPVDSAEVTLSAAYDAGAFRVTGELHTDLNCEASRGLTAEVGVLRDGAPLGTSAVISVPGAYDLPVSIGCGGGSLQVFADVEQSDGGAAPRAFADFEAPVLPASVGSIDGGVLFAACGAGARGEVSTRFAPGQCPTAEVTWTQLSGPALASATLSGTTVQVQTLSEGLDGLIGETVELQVEANAGDGNTDLTTHSLLILPEDHFISLTQEAAEPIAEEGNVLRLGVTATNLVACPVSEVTLRQRLEGATYLDGSARLDGVPVAASMEDGALLIPGVRFEASQQRQLTYSVRPRLLGEVSPEGRAFVNGHAVSEEAQLSVPAGGCECGSAPGGAMALGALLLLRLLRRRRA